MPIYEFECPHCSKVFEELVFSQTEVPPCPKCGSTHTKRVLSACRHKSGGGGRDFGPPASAPSSSGGGCSGCSGGSCSTCK